MTANATRQSVEELRSTLREIGVARFEGRIEAGIIDRAKGEAVVDAFIAEQRSRPWVSRVVNFVLDAEESYR